MYRCVDQNNVLKMTTNSLTKGILRNEVVNIMKLIVPLIYVHPVHYEPNIKLKKYEDDTFSSVASIEADVIKSFPGQIHEHIKLIASLVTVEKPGLSFLEPVFLNEEKSDRISTFFR